MATASQLIDDTLDWLWGGTAGDQINVLASDPSSSDTSLTFTYDLEGIVPGAHICIDLEVMRVVQTNTTAKTATVIRAQRGSTAASHSDGAVVQVSPRFSRWSVFNAINDELDNLSGEGMFQIKTVDLTFNASIMGYDLTSVTDLEDIYSVRYKVPGPQKEWPLIAPSKWRFDRNASTTDFASGFSLVIYGGGYSGQTVRVAYKAPFTNFTTSAQDLTTYAGFPATGTKLLRIGAALQLTAGHEAGRIGYETQPDTRRPDEVPVGSTIQTVSGWRALRRDLLDSELKRLSRRYPMRKY